MVPVLAEVVVVVQERLCSGWTTISTLNHNLQARDIMLSMSGEKM